jgi:hypothetical protein
MNLAPVSRRILTGLVVFAAAGCGGSTFSAGQDTDDGGSGSNNTTGSGGTSQGSGGNETGGNSTTGSGGGSTTGVGGASGTGGNVGTGGSSGTAGSVTHHDGGVAVCTGGTTTFHMTEASGTDYCVGVQCTLSWVSVKSMTGKVMSLSGGCVTNCDVCQPIACGAAACIAPQHLKPEGQTLTWDGTYYEPSKCGAGISCQDKQCAPPGRYVATMCANKNTSDAGIAGFCQGFDSMPTCVDVEFDYPSMKTVEGVVGK